MEEKKRSKEYRIIIYSVVILALVLVYGKELSRAVGYVLGIIKPFLIGGAFAFVLNLPMCFIEKHMLSAMKGKRRKFLRPLSIFLSLLFVLLLVAILLLLVVPEIVDATASIIKEVPPFLGKADKWVREELGPLINDTPWLLEKISDNWEAIVEEITLVLKSGLGVIFSSTVSAAGSIISGVTSFFISLIFAVYVLGDKERLKNQVRKLMKAYLKPEWNRKAEHIASVLNKSFSSFITGQCLEAVILGSIFIVVLSILRMPYAMMIGVLTMFSALLPIVGAFISCFFGAFLILLESPIKALWFVIIFFVIQQLENNLIYPRVVGSSVGLPALWVFVAVSVGGSLFGVVGMVVFIPIVSTLYTLVKEDTDKKLSPNA